MNHYKAQIMHKSSFNRKTVYVSAPDYASVELVIKKEFEYYLLEKIELQGDGFVFSSRYVDKTKELDNG